MIKTDMDRFKLKNPSNTCKKQYLHSDLTERIINACLEVHKTLGPGYKEKIYRNAVLLALISRNLKYVIEKEYNVSFNNRVVGLFRADLVVENKVIVEIKATKGPVLDLFRAQLIAYLKSSGIEIGLLINFANEALEIRRLARYHDFVNSV